MERMEINPQGALEAARRFMAAGRMDAADLLVEDVLSAEPGHVDALALRASLLIAQGQVEHAFELLGALASHQPGRADIVASLGMVHRLAGRADDALFCFERAVELEPAACAHRLTLAAFLLAAGDLGRARDQVAAVLDRRPQEGLELLAQAHALAGRIAFMADGPFAAEQALRKALELRPGEGEDLALLSEVLARTGRRGEALELARQAYLQAPTDHGAALLLARRLVDMNRWEEAERHLRRIVATAPYHMEANHLLASRFILKGEGARALASFGELVRRDPENVDQLLRMAQLLRLGGDLERALSFVEVAARQAPAAAAVKAMGDDLRLALGRVGEVWPPPAEPPSPPVLAVPLGTPAADVVLLGRFARQLAPAGSRLTCHAEPELQPVLAGLVGLAPTTDRPPADAVALTDLPALVGVSIADDGAELPTAPYLAVEARRDDTWRAAFSEFPRPLVGLVWDEDEPGIMLDALMAALGERPEGRGTWVSLAFDASRRQLAAHPSIVDAGAHFGDFRDLAAAIAQLDLVVGPGALALHVAGALGREGIVLSPAHQPWAWARRAERALWYPTLRVIGQGTPGRWDDALAALRSTMAPEAAQEEVA